MMGRKPRKAKASGPSQTDQSRAERGIGRITLRLPETVLGQLEALAAARGLGRAELVAELVAAAAERAQRRARFT
jgi:hypothetical protein